MKQKPIQNENREDCQDSYALTVSVIAGIVDDWSLNDDEPVYNAVLRMKAELFELRVQVIRLQLNDDPTQ